MVGVLGETFYCVDQIRFSCLKISKANVEDILRNLDFTVQEFNIFPAQDRENNKVSDFEAFFFLVALKSTKTIQACATRLAGYKTYCFTVDVDMETM